MVMCHSTMRETWVQSLGQEDPLEKETTIHSSIIAWEIPWTEEPGRLLSMGPHIVEYDRSTNTDISFFFFFCSLFFNYLFIYLFFYFTMLYWFCHTLT